MQRLRELLAHGGVAILASVFALAFAGFYLARALAELIYSAIEQHTLDEGEVAGAFTVFDTRIAYSELLLYAITLTLLGLALYGTWRLTRTTSRVCPECRSSVPAMASVCRYCTTELPRDAAANA